MEISSYVTLEDAPVDGAEGEISRSAMRGRQDLTRAVLLQFSLST
jgi:hypothetical protein